MNEEAVRELLQPLTEEIERLKEHKGAMEEKITTLEQQLEEKPLQAPEEENVEEELTENLPKEEEAPADSKNKGHKPNIPRMKSFTNGENFARFITRFTEHVTYNGIQDCNLYLYFLTLLDEITYDKLRKIQLTKAEKQNSKSFCQKYIEAYYPKGQKSTLRNEMINVKQQAEEGIEDFAFRVSELGLTAYGDGSAFEPACITAFIQGVTDAKIKYELLKDKSDSYDEIVNNAKQLETIAKIQATDETGIPNTFNLLAVGRDNTMSMQARGSRDMSTVVCYSCRATGHYKNRCPKLQTLTNNYNQGGFYNMPPPAAFPNQSTPFQQRYPPPTLLQTTAQPKQCDFCRTTTHATVDCWSRNNIRRNFQRGAGSADPSPSTSTNTTNNIQQ